MAELTSPIIKRHPLTKQNEDGDSRLAVYEVTHTAVAAAGGHIILEASKAPKVLAVLNASLEDTASGGAVKDDVASTATLTFTGAVTADETCVVGSVTYTAKAAPTAANEFDVGADKTAQASALDDAIRALGDTEGTGTLANPEVTSSDAAGDGTLAITVRDKGSAGDSVALTEALSNATFGSLSGGVDGSQARAASLTATLTGAATAADTLTVTGPDGRETLVYTAHATPNVVRHFDVGASLTAQATAIVDVINGLGGTEQGASGLAMGPNPWMRAEQRGDEVEFTALAPGREGNNLKVAVSAGFTEMTFANSGVFSGGLDAGEGGSGLGGVRAFPNSTSAAANGTTDGAIFVDHGASGTATLKLTLLVKE